MVAQWTDFAWQMLSQTSNSILIEFGYKSYKLFLNKVDEGVNTIMQFPNSGKKEPLLNHKPISYRSIVVDKFNKIVYYIDKDNDVIVISDFWDIRQEPNLLSSSI